MRTYSVEDQIIRITYSDLSNRFRSSSWECLINDGDTGLVTIGLIVVLFIIRNFITGRNEFADKR